MITDPSTFDALPTLRCERLYFRYAPKSNWVINDFSFDFPCGITLIKGASGCGKSTLLRLLAGYLNPIAGSIATPDGRQPSDPLFQRRDLGYVFQHLNLLPLATVTRNLELAGTLAPIPPEHLIDRIEYWLAVLGLAELASARPARLSGGQQQRAALARALVKEPTVLLLDEHTSGLDDLNTRLITETLLSYVTENFSLDENPRGPRVCVICSHDPRLHDIAHETLDFNCFLPLERHLGSLLGTTE